MTAMAYNLRYASDEGPHAWHLRLPLAVEMLESEDPDLIGTQEGLYRQLKDLDAALPRYRWIGLGRDGGSRGEFMAIFYRHERFEPLEYDHYWLSDTPDVIGSASWGNDNRRMVTWVRFRDRSSGEELYFINTHFDHRLQAAREKSAALVWEKTQELDGHLPIVLVGDFNAAAGNNPAYSHLVAEDRFRDSWPEAHDRGPAVGTFHGYRGPRPDGARIDWILLRGPIRAKATHVVTFERDGAYPSDHFPVVARLSLSASP